MDEEVVTKDRLNTDGERVKMGNTWRERLMMITDRCEKLEHKGRLNNGTRIQKHTREHGN